MDILLPLLHTTLSQSSSRHHLLPGLHKKLNHLRNLTALRRGRPAPDTRLLGYPLQRCIFLGHGPPRTDLDRIVKQLRVMGVGPAETFKGGRFGQGAQGRPVTFLVSIPANTPPVVASPTIFTQILGIRQVNSQQMIIEPGW